MVIDFTVASQAPCVQGHFPGAPVVPGAYLLAQIDAALREHFPDCELTGFGKVKFLAPLRPGEEAHLHLDPAVGTKIQVRMTRGEELLLTASALIHKT
jgi:3-hydroxyacyl-[acyl-carrier-protein] dehydratase